MNWLTLLVLRESTQIQQVVAGCFNVIKNMCMKAETRKHHSVTDTKRPRFKVFEQNRCCKSLGSGNAQICECIAMYFLFCQTNKKIGKDMFEVPR